MTRAGKAAAAVAALGTFEAIDAAFAANRGPDGRIRNLALARRLAARERELAIAALGWDPETADPASRYAATGGELRRWAEEGPLPGISGRAVGQ